MQRLLLSATVIAALVAGGCAQNVPLGYQWNEDHNAAAFVDEPSAPGGDSHPMNCRVAAVTGGVKDNWWAWNQITVNGFEKFCTTPDGHVATLFMPNNSVGTPSVAAYVVPAAILGGSNLGAGALIAGGARNAAQIGVSAVSHGSPTVIQTQTTTVGATALSVNNLSATAGANSISGAAAVAH